LTRFQARTTKQCSGSFRITIFELTVQTKERFFYPNGMGQHPMFATTNMGVEVGIECLKGGNSGSNLLLWLCLAQRRGCAKNIPKRSTRVCG
jgi:hypothetical protein